MFSITICWPRLSPTRGAMSRADVDRAAGSERHDQGDGPRRQSWADAAPPPPAAQASRTATTALRMCSFLACASALAPLVLIGAAHFAISRGMKLARNSGVRWCDGGTRSPSCSSRSRTHGVSWASLAARLRRRTISPGVPFGKNSAFHPLPSNSARPCSPAVATSPSTAERLSPRVAIGLTVRAAICGDPVEITSHRKSMRPPPGLASPGRCRDRARE